MFSTNEILDLAVRIEENGERFYREAMERVSDPPLMAMLGIVAEEEARHRDWFIGMKRRGLTGSMDPLFDRISGALLQDALEDHGFSLDEVDLASLPDEEAILRVAIGFEEDSIAFYEILGGFVEDEETSKHIEAIIAEERRHIDLLGEHLTLTEK